jgi:putative sigma-54 modulation protein
MDVTVRGRNVEVSRQLRAAAEEKVSRLGRLLQGMEHAEVHFYEERNPRISEKEVCEVTLAGHGHLVRAKAASPDAFTAVDRVVDKLEHQLAKLKGKLIGRSHPRRQGSLSAPRADEGDGGQDAERRPLIFKTKQFAIKPMTPEEAVLQMELLGHDFYFFTNAETDRAAVVYRRNDGNVGLIDAS